MKPTLLIFLVFLALLNPCLARPQSKLGQNAEDLKRKINVLEETDISSTSQAVQELYKRTLLRLYAQYLEAINADLAALKLIGANADGSADSQTEITARLSALKTAHDVTSENQKRLEADLKVGRSADSLVEGQTVGYAKPAEQSPGLSPRISDVNDQRLSMANKLLKPNTGTSSTAVAEKKEDAPAKPEKVILYGTVLVTNKYFYKNPENITLSSLRAERLLDSAKDLSSTLSATDREQLESYTVPGQSYKSNRRMEFKGSVLNRPLSNVEVKITGTATPATTPAKTATSDVKVNDVTDAAKNGTKVDDEAATGNKDKKAVVITTITSSLGRYQVSLEPGEYIITVKTENFTASEPVSITSSETLVRQDLQVIVKPLGEFSRAIVGLEQAGASSAKSAQRYFFDLTVSTPLPFQKNIDPYFGPKARAWGTVRVTSVPQQINSAVGTFAAGFGTQVSNLKVNEVAQAVEFLGGVEYRLTGGKGGGGPFGSFDNSTSNKFTLSLIAGGGAITPLNPRDTLEIFKVTPGAQGLPKEAEGKDFIAFVSSDRDRFFRQFYAGLRARTWYFDSRNDGIPLNRYPASLDVTFGQNESLTGGRLRGGVLRLEGFFPLPYESLKFINVFGTAMMKLSRTRITNPLILEPAPAGTTVPASNAVIFTVPQMNRDYYRIGVGIDFVSLIKSWGAGQKDH